jgi:tryptophan-rich sensory protein
MLRSIKTESCVDVKNSETADVERSVFVFLFSLHNFFFTDVNSGVHSNHGAMCLLSPSFRTVSLFAVLNEKVQSFTAFFLLCYLCLICLMTVYQLRRIVQAALGESKSEKRLNQPSFSGPEILKKWGL